MKKIVVLLSAMLLLAGCDYTFPQVDSGYVRTPMGPNSTEKRELTFLQVAALSDWFAAHRTGWSREIADVAPNTGITLRRKGAEVVTVYLSGPRLLAAGYARALTLEEAGTLERILNVGWGGNDGVKAPVGPAGA